MSKTGIYVNAGMPTNYLKTKAFMKKKQIPAERLEEILFSIFIHFSFSFSFFFSLTAHMRPGIQIQVRNTVFLPLASFEDTFTQGMRLEI